MNFEINKLRVDEVEINIKGIVESCLQKLKLIIACGLVFAILVPTIVYVVDVKNYNELQKNSLTASSIELSDAEEAGVDTYLLLKNRVSQLEEYKEKSVILNTKSSYINQGNISYHIESDEDVQYDIACAFASMINDATLVETMNQMGLDTTFQQDIIETEVAGESTGISSGVLNIKIYALSENECREYMEAAKKMVSECSAKLQTSVAEHNISAIYENYHSGYSKNIHDKQKVFIENWQNANTVLTTNEATLSANQIMYINGLNAEQQDELNSVAEKPTFSLIFMIIGFVLGILVGVVIVFVQVVFGGRIQTEQELLKRLNVSNLGIVKPKKKGLDSQLNLVCTRIEMLLQSSPQKRIGLISTTDVLSWDFISQLVCMLKAKGISCEIIGNVVTDPTAYSKAANISTVVMAEVLGRTKIKDVYDESIACKDLGVQVVGYITARE